MNSALAAAAGVVVGVIVGFLVWGGEDDTQPAPDDSRDVWLNFQCPPPPEPDTGTTVSDKLDEVTNASMNLPPEEKTPESEYCAVKAQQIKLAQPINMPERSGNVARAAEFAAAKDWVACKTELDQE